MFPRLRRSPTRTTLLGVAALAVLIWTAESQLGLGINNLLAQLLLLLFALLITIGLAGLLFALSRFIFRRSAGGSRLSDRLPSAGGMQEGGIRDGETNGGDIEDGDTKAVDQG